MDISKKDRLRDPSRHLARRSLPLLAVLTFCCGGPGVREAGAAAPTASSAANAPGTSQAAVKAAAAKPVFFDIDEYRVDGADHLPQIEIEKAVYPFLGPHRNADDVEKARAALETAYHDLGFQTVTVSIPPQNAETHVVVLKVTEGVVGRLRVKNAHYYDPEKIRAKAKSLAEGTLPNFKDVTSDIVALNQMPDRRVTPALRAGVTPGTVDVDLNVDDKVPFHGTVELNNRQSPFTTPLRVATTVHYDNLWQLGHSLSFSFQVAPQKPENALVFSGSYLANLNDWLSFMTYAVDSNSNVSAVGGLDIVGPGQILGERAVLTLPPRDNFLHTLSAGVDYKHFGQTVGLVGQTPFSSPVTYFPFVATYNATFQTDKAVTVFNTAANLGLRGLGSSYYEFDNKRYNANTSFAHLNGDISHSHDLAQGFQIYGKLQGQVADGALVSSEQISLGGFDTVRGYLESEALSDNGAAGTLEIRSPDLAPEVHKLIQDHEDDGPKIAVNAWRFFGFSDAGAGSIYDALPGEKPRFILASSGGGATFKVFDNFNGMAVVAVPLIKGTYTHAGVAHFIFRAWGEF